MEQQYDPVKAHQYYEENKQLKGRLKKATTATTTKKAKKNSKTQVQRKKNTEEAKRKQQALKAKFSSAIATLRARIKGMKNGKDSKYLKLKYQKEIANLRKDYTAQKKAISDEYKAKNAALTKKKSSK